jgi:rare lipoprotein A
MVSDIGAGFLLVNKADKSVAKIISCTFLTLVFCISCSIDPTIVSDGKSKEAVKIPVDIMAIPDAVPKYEKRTRAGNPGKYKVFGKQYKVLADSKGYRQKGIASWYGKKFHGRKTSNGEVYDMYAMTAAHKTLPIPSYVRVTHLKNQRSVILRINDRGPFHKNRIIDLSYAAAVKLGIQQSGTGVVEVVTLEPEVTKKQEIETVDTVNNQAATSVYLQVGAFNNQNNARKLQKKLIAGQINNSRIQFSQKQTKEIYAVQVGPIDSAHQADKVNEKLAFLGMMDTQLIVEKQADQKKVADR